MVFFELLFFLLLLIVNGEPLRFLFSKRSKLLSSMNLAEAFIIDVYLGGFLFYIIAMLPFSLLNKAVVISLTILNAVFSLLIHSHSLRRASHEKVATLTSRNKIAITDFVFVFAVFSAFLIIELISLSNLVLGSVHDTSLHSLMVQTILENSKVPLSLQPYLPEGVIYPQATHVIFASASQVLGYNSAKSVFYVTPLFSALSVFGAYLLGRRLWNHRPFYLGLSFTFAFISCWPLYITWGGNPFVVGFPLFLACLGLLFSLIISPENITFDDLIVAGLLFGFAGVIILSYLQTLLVIGFLCVVYWLARKRTSFRSIIPKSLAFFVVSMLPLSPFLLRFVVFYQYPGHNIGVASDFAGYPKDRFLGLHVLQWLFEQLSPYLWTRAIMLFLLVGLAVLMWRMKDRRDIKRGVAFAAVTFVSAVLLSFVSFVLPSDFNIVSWGHQGVILVIPLNILLVFSYIKLDSYVRQHKPQKLARAFSKVSRSDIIVSVMLFSLLVAPFLYYRTFEDPAYVHGLYELFAVTTEDDYRLMLWMRENLTSTAVVIVNPYDAGLFIPSISQHKIIYPYSASWYTGSYQNLTRALWADTLNETTYQLMRYFNASHVFVGSKAAYNWVDDYIWNPNLFIGNPNFKLEKNFGKAYLFRINYTDQHIVFLDDFEHELWSDNGWNVQYYENGVGNAAIVTDAASQSRLQVTAQCISDFQGGYAYALHREIFIPRNSSVSLSFYWNATQGFSGTDAVAVIVSNYYHNQTIVFATPDSFWSKYPYTISLDAFEVSFAVDLSALWWQKFNSDLTNPFILELVNYDADGVENIAYIDDVIVTSMPI